MSRRASTSADCFSQSGPTAEGPGGFRRAQPVWYRSAVPTRPTHPEETHEAALLAAWFERRDEPAAEELWRRYQRLAVAIGARILRGTSAPLDEARGIADEMFVRALGRWDAERAAPSEAPFRSFYVTLVKHAALDRARRRERVHVVAEAPDVGADPRDQLHAAITLRESLPRMREALARRFLPQDVALFERWLAEQSEGGRIPWTAWAEEFPVEVEEVIGFALHQAEVEHVRELEPIARALRLCPKVQVAVRGTATPEEEAELADQRAAAVIRALTEDLDPRTTRTPDGTSVPRLIPRAEVDAGPPRVDFEVTVGRTRTPAALRMRVTSVLLPAARAVFEADAGGER